MRAILLCAGKGTRLRPMTYLKPKPLLSIGGKTMIERIIIMLRDAGVNDISIVGGYMCEKLKPIAEQYGATLYFSEKYETTNNNTSLNLVKHKLDDCFIVDGDLYLHQNIFKFVKPSVSQFLSQKNLSGIEWEIFSNEEDIITGMVKDSRTGYCASGVSYWTGKAAAALSAELDNCSADEYWEDAALRVLKEHPVYITKVPQIITEIDTIYEAISKGLITADEVAEQCSQVQPERLKGLTNATYLVDYGDGKKVLRIPGLGTDSIDRDHERKVDLIITGSDIAPETKYYENGIKVSTFLDKYRCVQQSDLSKSFIENFAKLLNKLHSFKYTEYSDIQAFSVFNDMIDYEKNGAKNLLDKSEKNIIYNLCKQMDADEKVLCHRDLLYGNILFNPADNDIRLIDFEYAQFTSKYWDLANFINEAMLDESQIDLFLSAYGNCDRQRVNNARLVTEYWAALWGWCFNCIPYGRGRLMNFHSLFEKYLV